MESTRAELHASLDSNDSWIHDTAGSEMPDPSKSAELKRRLAANSSVFRSQISQPFVFVPLAIGVLGVGVFFLRKAFGGKDRPIELDDSLALELG